MNMIEGQKTNLTAIVAAAFNLLSATGFISVSPEAIESINAGLLSLIGLFLSFKINRWKKESSGGLP